MPNPMEEAELRAGVEPIGQLLAERGVLIDKVADLRAKYGNFGTHEALRKAELARISGVLRARYSLAKAKVSAAQIDDEAHGHPDYIEFITEATKQRARWVRLEAEIEDIDKRVNRGQAILRFVSMERTL